MNKTKVEYGARCDGKFNIWKKVDIVPDDGTVPTYGDWHIIAVCATKEEAVNTMYQARRDAR